MKLLLTSSGLRNTSLVTALEELVVRPFSEVSLAFVPTAANVESGGKEWLIDDLVNCRKVGFKAVDIVDFSATPRDVWLPRFEEADVLLFGGGNTFHLMHMIETFGLKRELVRLLETRVYVGISAGSMIATESLSLSTSSRLYSEGFGEIQGDRGLGLVSFQIRPHLNSPHFPQIRIENLEKHAREVRDTFYALDDESAVKVVDGVVEVVSEGEWKKFN
jgi:dipeptidase E